MKSGYDCFVPHDLKHLKLNIDAELQSLINKANLLLGKLDGITTVLSNIVLFVSMYVQKEAVISSQIEVTQASLIDVFQKDRETSEIVIISKPLTIFLLE